MNSSSNEIGNNNDDNNNDNINTHKKVEEEVEESVTGGELRIITKVCDCLERRFGPVRIVGTVDIDGYGTSHNITGEETDPFVLSEYVRMPAHIKPPFCAHPHSGACVISIQLEGYDIQPWDNLYGDEKLRLESGGIYLLQSGFGCVHDEPTILIQNNNNNDNDNTTENNTNNIKKIDSITNTIRYDGKVRRFFQIWTNPDIYQDDLSMPYSYVGIPNAIPTVRNGNVYARILVGEYNTVKGAIQVDTWPSTTIVHITIPVGKHGSILIPKEYNAHLFVESGSASFVGRRPSCYDNNGDLDNNKDDDDVNDSTKEYKVDISYSQFKLILCRAHHYDNQNNNNNAGEQDTTPRLKVYNIGKKKDEENKEDNDQGDLHIMLFMGIPHNKPFYKLLGYGGALMHKNEELVRALMVEYEKNPQDFGRKNASIINASLPPNTSDDKYDMIEGYYDKGDDARPGLLGRWKERETISKNQIKEWSQS